MKDIVNHYRTLVGEALMALDLGHAQEWVEETAYRLGKRIKPTPTNPLEGWQDMGWLDETGIQLYEQFRERSAQAMANYFDELDRRIIFGDGPTSAQAFRAYEAPKAQRAETMHREIAESIRPAVERLLGEGTVEWGMPEVRTAEATAKAKAALEQIHVAPQVFDITDGFGEVIRQWVDAYENFAYPVKFIAGIDPDAEWVYLQRDVVAKACTVQAPPGMLNTFFGISLFDDPDDETRLRIRADDLRRHPDGVKIYESLRDAAEAQE